MTNSIDASLYGLTKRNNGNFKSEKQRAFLTSKFGQFCAKDEYLVLGSGMGSAKNTTWVDIFKLSADGSKIESIYRSYTSSKGAKDRFTWVAMPDDEYNDQQSKLKDSNKEFYRDQIKSIKEHISGVRLEFSKKLIEYRKFEKFCNDSNREFDSKNARYLFSINDIIRDYRRFKDDIARYEKLLTN